MGTAGDDFLRGLLGGNQPLTATATKPTATERSAQANTEIDEEARKAREAEHERVQDGPWNPFGTGHTTVVNNGGGGYAFDPEVIAQKITQWEQLLHDLREDGRELDDAVNAVKPPSADQPAGEQAEATRQSIIAAIEHNVRMRKYARAYIDGLRKANGTYVQHDEEVAEGLDRQPTNGLDK
jgi:ElaB/YqjD/DUF883 family membrane-anchored ribosome-binding protein